TMNAMVKLPAGSIRRFLHNVMSFFLHDFLQVKYFKTPTHTESRWTISSCLETHKVATSNHRPKYTILSQRDDTYRARENVSESLLFKCYSMVDRELHV